MTDNKWEGDAALAPGPEGGGGESQSDSESLAPDHAEPAPEPAPVSPEVEKKQRPPISSTLKDFFQGFRRQRQPSDPDDTIRPERALRPEKKLNGVIIGPAKSGKSLLLRSLPRAAQTQIHGYHPLKVSYREVRGGQEFQGNEDGAEALSVCSDQVTANFSFVFDENGKAPKLFFSVSEVDSGDYLSDVVLNDINSSDFILLTIPAKFIGDIRCVRTEKKLYDLMYTQEVRPRTLIVCITMYELLFRSMGTDGIRHALSEDEAERIACKILKKSGLGPILKELRRKGWTIVVAPLSVFGFIPRNGAANVLTKKHENSMSVDYLRTSPVSVPTRNGDVNIFEGYRGWVPFMVLNPFLFMARDYYGRTVLTVDSIINKI